MLPNQNDPVNVTPNKEPKNDLIFTKQRSKKQNNNNKKKKKKKKQKQNLKKKVFWEQIIFEQR